MSFAEAAQRMLDSQYRTMGVAVLWTPAGAGQLTLTGLARLGEDSAPADGLGLAIVKPWTVRLRKTEVEEQSPTADPTQGDRLSIDGEAFVINGDPTRTGQRRLEWTCELAPS